VGAADAATCFLDRTPKPAPAETIAVAARDRGAGRPTKRDRRMMDKLRAGRLAAVADPTGAGFNLSSLNQ
jgi:ribosome-associated heat shock protein Hsp15